MSCELNEALAAAGQPFRSAVSLALGIGLMVNGSAALADEYDFDVDAQRTDGSLIEIAKTGDVQVLFAPDPVEKNHSPEVRGTQSVDSALETSLSQSNLSYEFKSDDFVVVTESAQGEKVMHTAKTSSVSPVLLAQLQDDRSRNDVASTLESSDDESTVATELDVITVTGTRMSGANAAGAHVVSVDQADFELRGFSSISDVLRAIPQNHGSGLSSFFETGGGGLNTTALGLGARDATNIANLRGLGANRTLVLVNGRRVADSQAVFDPATDLNSIPFNSIERIEIMLDGGSAVYGADAQGGVINIITRTDYSGFDVGVRYQDESTGGKDTRVQANFGHGWDSGSFMVGVAYNEVDPVVAAETLYGGAQDLTAFGGPDNRSIFGSRMPSFAPLGGGFFDPRFVLPLGDAGSGPIEADDLEGTTGRLQSLPPSFFFPDDPVVIANKFENGNLYWGSFRENDSAFLAIRQSLGERVQTRLDIRYTKSDTRYIQQIPSASFIVPTSNAFNNTGQPLEVEYSFVSEIANGLILRDQQLSESESLTFDLSGEVSLTDDWLLKVAVTQSDSESSSAKIGTFEFSAPPPAEFLAAVANSNPATAFNPFGDGSGSTLDLTGLARAIEGVRPSKGKSRTYELSVEGALFELPGGDVRTLFGAEVRSNEREPATSFSESFGDFVFDGGKQDTVAYFAEVAIPVIGEGNALSWLQSLDISLQAREDDYDYVPDVTVLASPLDVLDPNFDPFNPNLNSTKYDFNSGLVPRFGVSMRLWNDVTLRYSYSEAFRAPALGDAFLNLFVSAPSPFFPFVDPLSPANPPTFPFTITQSNLSLGPETGETRTVGLDWTPSFIEGLRVSATYSDIRTEDVISSTNQFLAGDLDAVGALVAANGPEFIDQFIVRDATGLPVATITTQTNFGNLRQRAVDFNIEYMFNAASADFVVGVDGTRNLENDQRFPFFNNPIISGTLPDRVGTEVGPDDWLGKIFVSMSRGDLDLSVFYNYSSSYINSVSNVPGASDPATDLEKVSSYATWDITGSYRFSDWGLKLNAGIRNVTDADAPFYNFSTPFGGSGQTGIDAQRVDLRGRMIFLELIKSFEF